MCDCAYWSLRNCPAWENWTNTPFWDTENDWYTFDGIPAWIWIKFIGTVNITVITVWRKRVILICPPRLIRLLRRYSKQLTMNALHTHVYNKHTFWHVITLNIMVLSLYPSKYSIWMHQMRIDKYTRSWIATIYPLKFQS